MDPKEISNFATLLRNNGDKVLNSEYKLTLSGEYLSEKKEETSVHKLSFNRFFLIFPEFYFLATPILSLNFTNLHFLLMLDAPIPPENSFLFVRFR